MSLSYSPKTKHTLPNTLPKGKPKKNNINPQPTKQNKKSIAEHVEIRRLDHFFNAVAGPTSSLPSLELLLAFASAVAEAVATASGTEEQSMPVELQRWLCPRFLAFVFERNTGGGENLLCVCVLCFFFWDFSFRNLDIVEFGRYI